MSLCEYPTLVICYFSQIKWKTPYISLCVVSFARLETCSLVGQFLWLIVAPPTWRRKDKPNHSTQRRSSSKTRAPFPLCNPKRHKQRRGFRTRWGITKRQRGEVPKGLPQPTCNKEKHADLFPLLVTTPLLVVGSTVLFEINYVQIWHDKHPTPFFFLFSFLFFFFSSLTIKWSSTKKSSGVLLYLHCTMYWGEESELWQALCWRDTRGQKRDKEGARGPFLEQ